MEVIRVYARVKGIKGRDRKVKSHWDRLTDIKVENRDTFNAIEKYKVKEYLDANLDYSLLDKHKKNFKKIEQITLEINHVSLSAERGYTTESFEPLAAKYAVLV